MYKLWLGAASQKLHGTVKNFETGEEWRLVRGELL
jgi:hypothetical protein